MGQLEMVGVQDGLGQVLAEVLGGGEAGFELVAEGH